MLKGKKGQIQFIPAVTMAVIVLIGLASFPLIFKIFQLSFFTDFSFGNPLTIFTVGFLLMVLILRRARRT